MSGQRIKYRVLVDDNFHYMDESERYTLGEFDDRDEALSRCMAIVDDFLFAARPNHANAGSLYSHYQAFGEDPFIISDDPVDFSAWSYAKQRCGELYERTEGQCPTDE